MSRPCVRRSAVPGHGVRDRNPLLFTRAKNFHEVVEAFDRFDGSFETIPPGEVTEAAQRANVVFPNKRLSFHYRQPHFPSIGEDFDYEGQSASDIFNESVDSNRTAWEELRIGEVTRTEFQGVRGGTVAGDETRRRHPVGAGQDDRRHLRLREHG